MTIHTDAQGSHLQVLSIIVLLRWKLGIHELEICTCVYKLGFKTPVYALTLTILQRLQLRIHMYAYAWDACMQNISRKPADHQHAILV